MAYYSFNGDGLILHCHIQPKASRDAIAGIHNDRLKVQITAPPTDGKANDHLVRYLAKLLGTSKSKITLVSGQSSRQKTLLVAGIHSLPSQLPES